MIKRKITEIETEGERMKKWLTRRKPSKTSICQSIRSVLKSNFLIITVIKRTIFPIISILVILCSLHPTFNILFNRHYPWKNLTAIQEMMMAEANDDNNKNSSSDHNNRQLSWKQTMREEKKTMDSSKQLTERDRGREREKGEGKGSGRKAKRKIERQSIATDINGFGIVWRCTCIK